MLVDFTNINQSKKILQKQKKTIIIENAHISREFGFKPVRVFNLTI